MPKPSPVITREQEADRLIAMFGDTPAAASRIMEALERSFAVLHNRANLLLGLCGVIVTTTGFSGRLIAGTSTLSQWLVILGVCFAMVAAVIVVFGVLHIRWLSMHVGELVRPWLLTCLTYRDVKTSYYRIAMGFLLIGLAFYLAAIAVMLLHPTLAPPLPTVR